MRHTIYLLLMTLFLFNCGSSKSALGSSDLANIPEEDIVRIANDDIEYEITIIEPGFNSWLASIARPKGYYSQQYMETRNRIFVQEWNNRVLLPQRFDPNLYELQIDYQPNINYGYDVNYKLYNYFIYFQLTYKQQLSTFIPRI
ncbi:hypothetical protein SAMN04515667_2188 [Formosa sp. Hel1_31_208]|uniref:DUF6146 family protein n=1 Tax=Formosa sp. Hel1_31_208 TaxID=1798225 RepID=UPI00087BBA09|nr:DUF6146 family protein [Formosa sp. Hel1_31_208]SDS44205.1 hypothetical protein SAMN04515667_2188 [Formosa sp. Hel1_31_208]